MKTPGTSRVRALSARLHGVLRRSTDDEVRKEMQDHLQLLEDRFVAQGMPKEEAATSARRQFGNTTLLQEDRRALRTLPSMEALWLDLRYGVRTLRRSPGFAAASIVTLALGIGSATAIFSVIYNVLLVPFPYKDAHRMVNPRIYDVQRAPTTGRGAYSDAEVLEIAETNHVFDATTAVRPERVLYRYRSGTESLSGAHVTPGTFEFFGLQALHGRVLQPGDYDPGAPPVFVLGHKAWRERFGGDLSILNQTAVLNGVSRTLVGIMPPRFGWYGADVYVPGALQRDAPGRRFLLGHLKPGISPEQAAAELTVIARRLAAQHPQDYPRQFGVYIGLLGEFVVERIKPTLYTVLAAVGLLLLIACSNVANLLLVRATMREKELVLRSALGAGRTRIVRLLIVESLMLAASGAALGTLLAWGGLKALVAMLPAGQVPSESAIELNVPVLMVTLGIALLTALVCGLAPALQSFRQGQDLSGPLRESGKGTSGGFRGRRLRDAVVVMEVAVSLTLLVGAGLLMRSFFALREIDLGVQTDHVFTAALQLPADRYATDEQVTAFLRALLPRVKALPGVEYAAASTASALDAGAGSAGVEVEGKAQDSVAKTSIERVTGDYFPAVRFDFKRGSPLSEADVTDARKVAVVNESFTRAYLQGDDPIGKRLRLQTNETVSSTWYEIVGVVGDVRTRGPLSPTAPQVWIPGPITTRLPILTIRTSPDPLTLTSALRGEVSAVDPEVPLVNPGRLEDFADQAFYTSPRFGFLLMTVFGGVGLLLMTVGVYGVLAYSTARKTHEIGIRLALGAERTDVLGMVIGSGLRVVAVGITLGLAVSLLLGRMIDTQLVAVTALDPLTFAAAPALLVTIAAVACWIPARRAARVDPLVALRRE
jgi:putative ABC transport system permease protein